MSKNYFGITDVGKVRKNNEDAFIAQEVNGYILVAAIDGVGGYEGGEVAAKLARAAIINYMTANRGKPENNIREAVNAANEDIYKEKNLKKKTQKMACVLTMALVDVDNNKFYYAHVGDTRLYLFRDKGMVKLSKDHSFVGYLEDSGRLSEEAAMRHPKRNEINKGLGLDSGKNMPNDYIDSDGSPFLPGDIILLCSDGLTDMIDVKTITAILSEPSELEEKGKELIEAANKAGGRDNVTVVLVQNDKAPSLQTATRPASYAEASQKSDHTKALTSSNTSNQTLRKPSYKNITILLLILLCVWFIYKLNSGPAASPIPEKHNRNSAELQLVNALEDSSHTILFPHSNGPVIITDSLILQKDSLHLLGRGARFVCDSLYKGAAFVAGPNLSYLVLDSITFENFTIGIIAGNKSIHFRNVLFRNCKLPVLYKANIHNNELLNGVISGALFYPDSLAR